MCILNFITSKVNKNKKLVFSFSHVAHSAARSRPCSTICWKALNKTSREKCRWQWGNLRKYDSYLPCLIPLSSITIAITSVGEICAAIEKDKQWRYIKQGFRGESVRSAGLWDICSQVGIRRQINAKLSCSDRGRTNGGRRLIWTKKETFHLQRAVFFSPSPAWDASFALGT